LLQLHVNSAAPEYASPQCAELFVNVAFTFDSVDVMMYACCACLLAGSGGVRASRFAAQYYNAKVACIELPFGFVSSEDIGGEPQLTSNNDKTSFGQAIRPYMRGLYSASPLSTGVFCTAQHWNVHCRRRD
jgi:hypothetical protein